MCGRVTQKTGELPGFVSVTGGPDPSRPPQPRWNGAPSQDFWIIRKHPKTGEVQRDRLTWGLIPYWCKDRRPQADQCQGGDGGGAPNLPRCVCAPTVSAPHRQLLQMEGDQRAEGEAAYAIAMKSGEPFALAGIWENWRRPGSDEWLRTSCIRTTNANELVGDIHDRMPVIVPLEACQRWLANIEPDPRDLLVPYPLIPADDHVADFDAGE